MASGRLFGDQAKIAKALAPGGKGKVFCPDFGKPILLRDVIAEKFESPAVKEQVREMERGVRAASPSTSKRVLKTRRASHSRTSKRPEGRAPGQRTGSD